MRKTLPLSLLLLMACSKGGSTATVDPSGISLLSGTHTVTLNTSMGEITLKLDADAAPKTVTNFITLAKQEFYDNLTFHRVIENFMIQGGDPEGTGAGGQSVFGQPFEDEINAESYGLDTKLLRDSVEEELPAEVKDWTIKQYYEAQGYKYRDDLDSLPMQRGYIAMANRGPNTNGSQFFIIQTESTPWLEGKHTVFGKVTDGMEVVDAIAAVEVGDGGKPVTPVTFTVEVE